MAKGGKTGGRQKGTPNKATADMKTLLDREVDFSTLFSKLFELVEGITVQEVNKKGEAVTYTLPPDIRAAEMLLLYRFGKPVQGVDITTAGDKLMPPIIGLIIEQPTQDESTA